MLARCPSCRNTFSAVRSGRQDCSVCGKPLVVPEAPVPTAELVNAPEPPAPQAPGTPWERRAELGFVKAWAQTTQQALFEPSKLFASARLDKGSAQVGYAVLTASVFWALSQLIESLLMGGRNEQMRKLVEQLSGQQESPLMKYLLETEQAARSPAWVIGLALFTPVFSLMFLYLNAGVTHGVGLLLGQVKRGFPATMAACAYACAPMVLMAIPGCGSLISLVWLVVLTGIGLKETHRMSTGGAAASVLAPYAVLCCVLSLAMGALVTTAMRAMGKQ